MPPRPAWRHRRNWRANHSFCLAASAQRRKSPYALRGCSIPALLLGGEKHLIRWIPGQYRRDIAKLRRKIHMHEKNPHLRFLPAAATAASSSKIMKCRGKKTSHRLFAQCAQWKRSTMTPSQRKFAPTAFMLIAAMPSARGLDFTGVRFREIFDPQGLEQLASSMKTRKFRGSSSRARSGSEA